MTALAVSVLVKVINTILKFYTFAAYVYYVPLQYRGDKTRSQPVNGNIATINVKMVNLMP